MLDVGQIHRNEYELETSGGSFNETGQPISVAIAEAPGRIHFLGGQGDSQFDFYLSAAVDRCIRAAVSQRKDNSFRFYAADFNERKRTTLVNLKYKREDRWANYLKTVIYMFIELGYPIKGLNFTFCGDIPQQIAIASSTAIETAAAIALKSLLHVQINEVDLAHKLHEAHEFFFDSAASLADYQSCLMAKKSQFLVIDAFTGSIIKVKSPLSRFRILLIDSRVPRFGVENELTSRKADTIKGFQFLTEKLGTSAGGIHNGTSFKDFSSTDLLEALGDFPEQIRRRTTHIVEEMHRVGAACDALQRSDIASFAKIIFSSHESLRDVYEISCPEIDWLVKRAQELEGAAGSRMIGGGFGGCIYTIIRCELVEEYKKRLEEYERIFGFRPVIYEIKLATGARLINEHRGVYANTADQ